LLGLKCAFSSSPALLSSLARRRWIFALPGTTIAVMRCLIWLSTSAALCVARIFDNNEMSQRFDVHSQTCGRYDLDGLLEDTTEMHRKCLNALYDLRFNLLDGKTKADSMKLPMRDRAAAARKHTI